MAYIKKMYFLLKYSTYLNIKLLFLRPNSTAGIPKRSHKDHKVMETYLLQDLQFSHKVKLPRFTSIDGSKRSFPVFCTAGFWHWNSLTHLCLAHYTVTATVSIASQNETHTTFRFKQNPLEIFPPLIFCFKRPKWTSKISTAFGFSTIHIFFSIT